MKFIAMDREYWLRMVGVFCISCSSLLAHVEENSEEGEGAPEAIAEPLRLVLRGLDGMVFFLGLDVKQDISFTERWMESIIRDERLGLVAEERHEVENTWNHCLASFAEMRRSLGECTEKLDAMVVLAQAVRDMANGEPDYITEAEQNYLELCRAYRQQYLNSLPQRGEEFGFMSFRTWTRLWVPEGDVWIYGANEEQNALELVTAPLQRVSRELRYMELFLDTDIVGNINFPWKWTENIIRDERLGLAAEERHGIEDMWDHCLAGFAKVRRSLVECMTKVDTMVALAQAVRDVANGEPNRIAESQRNYEELREAYRQQHLNSAQQREEELRVMAFRIRHSLWEPEDNV